MYNKKKSQGGGSGGEKEVDSSSKARVEKRTREQAENWVRS